MHKKIFSVITIICFISIIFIPIGLVLMFFYTGWNKKLKIILSSVLTILYIALFLLFLKLEPSFNRGGLVLPVDYGAGSSEFDSGASSKNKMNEKLNELDDFVEGKNSDEAVQIDENIRIPKTVQRGQGRKLGRGFYSFMFLLFMLFLIIWQNIKSRKKTGYENPYVDVNAIKLPLKKNAVFPTVHYQKLTRRDGENFLFACEAKYNMMEGDIVISNQRFVFKALGEGVDFEIGELEAAASVSNTCFVLTRLEKKFYFFVDESQMRYVLNVLRFAANIEE